MFSRWMFRLLSGGLFWWKRRDVWFDWSSSAESIFLFPRLIISRIFKILFNQHRLRPVTLPPFFQHLIISFQCLILTTKLIIFLLNLQFGLEYLLNPQFLLLKLNIIILSDQHQWIQTFNLLFSYSIRQIIYLILKEFCHKEYHFR